MAIQRYQEDMAVTSDHDVIEVMVDWLDFLSAKQYLTDLLIETHHLTGKEAQNRAEKIIPHIRLANGYITQSYGGPKELSFLPAYYAILNLMKIYILTGSHHSLLDTQRHHGARYNVKEIDKRSILNEVITLEATGVFPLFYRTITNQAITSKVKVKLGDFLGCVAGVTHEYELATGKVGDIYGLKISSTNIHGATHPQIEVLSHKPINNIPRNRLHCLQHFRKSRTGVNIYLGTPIVSRSTLESEVKNQLVPHLLYRTSISYATTSGHKGPIQMPEELPIALLFFYMSSIVRYKPEFFTKLQDSKYWPLLTSARTHSFYCFLVSFWSFMHQKNYFINPGLRRS